MTVCDSAEVGVRRRLVGLTMFGLIIRIGNFRIVGFLNVLICLLGIRSEFCLKVLVSLNFLNGVRLVYGCGALTWLIALLTLLLMIGLVLLL